jgi:hypothetical protein
MRPTWFKLLEHHRENRFGLTLPFLVGAIRVPVGKTLLAEDDNYREFQALLESMRDDTPDLYYIRIAECDRLRQPVVSPCPSLYRPGSVDKRIPSRARNGCWLYVQPDYLPEEERGIASLVESMWRHSAQPILDGKFSYRNGSFQPFDENDLRFIREALAAVSEDEA